MLSYVWEKGGFLTSGGLEGDLLTECNKFVNDIVENDDFYGIRSYWFYNKDERCMELILEKNRLFYIAYEVHPTDVENLLRSYDYDRPVDLINGYSNNFLKHGMCEIYKEAYDRIDSYIDEYVVKVTETLLPLGFTISCEDNMYGKKLLLRSQ